METQEYKTEGLRFTVPANPTVRQQLQYVGAAAFASGNEFVIRLWSGALALILEWECELVPDPKAFDMDKETSAKAADLITWATMRVREHMNALDATEKNS